MISQSEHLAASNRRLTELRKLINSRKARRDAQRFVVDGPRALSTAVESGAEVVEVYLDDPERLAQLPRELGDDVAIFDVDRSVFEAVADTKTPQGVLAVVTWNPSSLASVVAHERVVVLDGVQDPGNVGAIVRVAAALGWVGVVAAKGCGDPWSPKSVRASAGTIGLVDVVDDVAVEDALEAASIAGAHVVGADMAPTIASDELDLAKPLVLVMGSEGMGLSAGATERIDDVVAVAMSPGVESLNVAVTAGILMHSLAR